MANPSEHTLSADFESRACDHLRFALPLETEGLSEDALRDRIRASAARCAAYGFTSEEQILYFVGACFLLGDNFDSDPDHAWAAEILKDAELSADERAAMLVAIAEVLDEDTQRR